MTAKQPAVKKYIVRLSTDERKRLTTLIQKGKAAARQLLNARILLKADDKFGEAFLALRGSRRYGHRAMAPTAPVSLRPDAISDAGAGLRPDWRLLDFVSDAVTGGEKCRGAHENKPAPSSEWPPA